MADQVLLCNLSQEHSLCPSKLAMHICSYTHQLEFHAACITMNTV